MQVYILALYVISKRTSDTEICEIRLHLFFQHEELDKLYRMVEVEVRGNDPAVLKSYSWFATTAASELGITVGQW